MENKEAEVTPIKEQTLAEQYASFERVYHQQCLQLGDLTYQIDRLTAASGDLKVKMLNTQHDGFKLKQKLDKETEEQKGDLT